MSCKQLEDHAVICINPFLILGWKDLIFNITYTTTLRTQLHIDITILASVLCTYLSKWKRKHAMQHTWPNLLCYFLTYSKNKEWSITRVHHQTHTHTHHHNHHQWQMDESLSNLIFLFLFESNFYYIIL